LAPRSHLRDDEPLLGEMLVERQALRDVQTPHDFETRAVHDAQLTTIGDELDRTQKIKCPLLLE